MQAFLLENVRSTYPPSLLVALLTTHLDVIDIYSTMRVLSTAFLLLVCRDPCFIAQHLPTIQSSTTWCTHLSFIHYRNVSDDFQTSPKHWQLVVHSPPNRFVILQTGCSLLGCPPPYLTISAVPFHFINCSFFMV